MTAARAPEIRLFGPFRFDVGDERLFREGTEIKLRRKPFAILRYLTAHPQRLVTQEELVEAVWGKIALSESLLRTHVSDVRRALGDGAVETVAGRGYRFLFAVEREKPQPRGPTHAATHPAPPNLVGRSAEIDTLAQVFEAALDQKRQTIFITGDPGIGKTTLVDAFLSEVAATKGALVASGSCVEHFGDGEAYLPVLAALGAACRAPDGERIVEVLARHGPMWLAQMPGLVADENMQALHTRIQGATQGRMLRELAEALDVLAAERPLVLVLEDMQWADRSTMDLVALLGTRREPARVLLIATCRQAELTKGDGLAKVIAELRAHKLALTVHLEALSQTAINDYLAQRFSNPHFPDELAGTIHGMTDGNPLFTVGVLDDLESQEMIRRVDGVWQLTATVAEVASRRPDTVRQLIDIQIDRLSSNEQKILEAASLAGAHFGARSAAHALDLPLDDVDTACERFASQQRFLRFVGSESWPDGTIQPHYRFVHALYRDAALARIPSATRRLWHQRVAEDLEAAHGENSETIAAELAVHFEEAQVIRKAVRYHCLAGERAMRQFGRAEALAQFNRARALIAQLPPSDEWERTELAILKQVRLSILAVLGSRTPLLEQTFTRTAELARKFGDDPGLLGALLDLQRSYLLRGELVKVEHREGEVTEVLSRLADPVATAEATLLSSGARLFRGQIATAQRSLTEASAVLDTVRNDTARMVHVVLLAWLRGAPDEAMTLAAKALAQAEAQRDPFQLCTALTLAALAHMWRREPEKACETGRRALQTARVVSSPVWSSRAMSVHHWAATVLDPRTASEHFEELSSQLPGLLAAGPSGRTSIAPCVAWVYAAAGRTDRALQELDDALAFVEASDERAWSSELHRARGDLIRDSNSAEAERAFHRALEISREQGAKSFELRAALSLAKLDRGVKKSRAGLEALRRAYGSFTEGFGTGDLVEAKALLDAWS
jgi:DNA-binding winged helix-turn-helix (wHTH) protein/tetratricopeptide (TPR) repeat protein